MYIKVFIFICYIWLIRSESNQTISINSKEIENTTNITNVLTAPIINNSNNQARSRKVSSTDNVPTDDKLKVQKVAAKQDNVVIKLPKLNSQTVLLEEQKNETKMQPKSVPGSNYQARDNVPIALSNETSGESKTEVNVEVKNKTLISISTTKPTQPTTITIKNSTLPTIATTTNTSKVATTAFINSTVSTIKTKPITSTTTAKTTTTVKPKPKKPIATYSIEDYPELLAKLQKPENNPQKAPEPEIELLQESPQHSEMIVPLLTIMLTVPLAVGVFITTYRRFKDCWSTRHYRRMDFLVDGMYND